VEVLSLSLKRRTGSRRPVSVNVPQPRDEAAYFLMKMACPFKL
jgi:hypothetical protein